MIKKKRALNTDKLVYLILEETTNIPGSQQLRVSRYSTLSHVIPKTVEVGSWTRYIYQVDSYKAKKGGKSRMQQEKLKNIHTTWW